MATYEFNSNLDQLDVTPGQAFEYESRIDRFARAHKAYQTIEPVNECFALMPCSNGYEVMRREGNQWRTMWYSVQEYYAHIDQTLRCDKVVQFASREEAMSFIYDFLFFFQWMSGLTASTPVEDAQVIEDATAEQYKKYEGSVIYYTEKSDNSERIALLKKVGRDGVYLADPADDEYDCWYSFTEICHVRRGRRHGWKDVIA